MTDKKRGRRGGSTFDSFSLTNDPRGERLSAQVCEALRLAVGDLDDPRLENAHVLHVSSAGASLRVTVEADLASIGDVEDALERCTPRLRGELATEIHRKRIPNLKFVVVPRSEEP